MVRAIFKPRSKHARHGAMASRVSYPFLFLGQGFGTSYKCCEGYIWFLRAPGERDKKKILALLPLPLRLGGRIEGCFMHFGSDDRLESFVKAAYCRRYAKTPFDEAVEALDAIWR